MIIGANSPAPENGTNMHLTKANLDKITGNFANVRFHHAAGDINIANDLTFSNFANLTFETTGEHDINLKSSVDLINNGTITLKSGGGIALEDGSYLAAADVKLGASAITIGDNINGLFDAVKVKIGNNPARPLIAYNATGTEILDESDRGGVLAIADYLAGQLSLEDPNLFTAVKLSTTPSSVYMRGLTGSQTTFGHAFGTSLISVNGVVDTTLRDNPALASLLDFSLDVVTTTYKIADDARWGFIKLVAGTVGIITTQSLDGAGQAILSVENNVAVTQQTINDITNQLYEAAQAKITSGEWTREQATGYLGTAGAAAIAVSTLVGKTGAKAKTLAAHHIDDFTNLGNVVMHKSAARVNIPFLEANPDFQPPWKAGTIVTEFTRTEANTQKYVRLYADELKQKGMWIMREQDIYHTNGTLKTAQELQAEFALPTLPTYISDVDFGIDSVTLQTGIANGILGHPGGGQQFYIEGFTNSQNLPQNWFFNQRSIGQ